MKASSRSRDNAAGLHRTVFSATEHAAIVVHIRVHVPKYRITDTCTEQPSLGGMMPYGSGGFRFLGAAMLAALTAACVSCGPPAAPHHADAPEVRPVFRPEVPHKEFGQLQVFITDQSSDGRTIKLRGLLQNPYAEDVDGVRIIFRVISTPGAAEEPREIDRVQDTLDDKRIAAGERSAIRFDVQTMYAGQSGRSLFSLDAFAIKLGGQDVPAPPIWKD